MTKLWNLSNIDLEDKNFHNSIEWSGPYLQVNILPWLGKIFRFLVFRLLENIFCELLPPPPPHEKLFLEKSLPSPYFRGAGTGETQ